VSCRPLLLEGGAVYGASVLKTGEIAPDFAVGERTLYQMLAERAAVIFFFPKAFTPG
jgi:peroxiredoxin